MSCQTPRSPFSGSGRNIEGGYLAVHKQDFNAHASGQDFRHCADNINMNPELNTIPGTDVQEVLENMEIAILNAGKMFISIGNVNGPARGNYNIGDPGIYTFEQAFAAAVADDHLVSGGTIVVLSGTYDVTSTISVPAGITIWGEPSGVIINAKMTEQSLFRILTSSNPQNIGSTTTSQAIIPTKLWNLTIVDNYNKEDGYTIKTVPLISCDYGSYFIMDKVSCIGHINNGTSIFSARVIDHNTLVSTSNASIMEIRDCYFDGFSTAIRFRATRGGKTDSLTVTNCKIRYFGNNVSGISEPDLSQNKSAISTTNCDININNNYFNGENDGINYFSSSPIYIQSTFVTGTASRINIKNNTGKLGDSASLATRRKFINNNYTLFTLIGLNDNSNVWEDSYGSKYQVSVGDGSKSFGDLSGSSALELAMNIYSLITDTVEIKVLPGTHTIAGNSISHKAHLIGTNNPTEIDRSIVSFAFTNSVNDIFARKTTYIGSAKNIQFTSANANQQSLTIIGGTALSTQCLENCEFLNVGAVLQPVNQQKAIIKNCYFYQDGSVDDFYSLVIREQRNDGITIEDCSFSGCGYAIACAQNDSYSENDDFVLNINRCKFDSIGFKITDAISAPSEFNPFKATYIFIDLGTTGKLNIQNSTFKNGYAVNGYQTIDSALIAAGINRLIYLQAKNTTIDNCTGEGPNQAQAGTLAPLVPFFHIDAVASLLIDNCSFMASQPLAITGTNIVIASTFDPIGAPTITISNSKLRHINVDSGFDNVCVASIKLPTITNGNSYELATLNILDNLIEGLVGVTWNTSSRMRYPYTGLHDIFINPTIGITAPSWNVNVSGNTILGQTPTYESSCATLCVFNNSSIYNSSNKITNNTIKTIVGLQTTKNNYAVCLYSNLASASVISNRITFVNNSSSQADDTGNIGWAYLAGYYYDITGNIFYRSGNIPKYGIKTTITQSIFDNNVFGNTFVNDSLKHTSSLIYQLYAGNKVVYNLQGTNDSALGTTFIFRKTELIENS